MFVSASTSETQGLTFAEAMSAGLPVIAKNDKCIEGLISDNQTGFLYNTQEEFIEKTVHVIKNRDSLAPLLNSAYESAQQFSSATFGKRVESLYKTVLQYPECFRPKYSDYEDILTSFPKKLRVIKGTSTHITHMAAKQAAVVKRYIKLHK